MKAINPTPAPSCDCCGYLNFPRVAQNRSIKTNRSSDRLRPFKIFFRHLNNALKKIGKNIQSIHQICSNYTKNTSSSQCCARSAKAHLIQLDCALLIAGMSAWCPSQKLLSILLLLLMCVCFTFFNMLTILCVTRREIYWWVSFFKWNAWYIFHFL